MTRRSLWIRRDAPGTRVYSLFPHVVQGVYRNVYRRRRRRRVELATIRYAEEPPLAFRYSWKRRRAAAAAEEEDGLRRFLLLPPVNPRPRLPLHSRSPEAEVSGTARKNGLRPSSSPIANFTYAMLSRLNYLPLCP